MYEFNSCIDEAANYQSWIAVINLWDVKRCNEKLPHRMSNESGAAMLRISLWNAHQERVVLLMWVIMEQSESSQISRLRTGWRPIWRRVQVHVDRRSTTSPQFCWRSVGDDYWTSSHWWRPHISIYWQKGIQFGLTGSDRRSAYIWRWSLSARMVISSLALYIVKRSGPRTEPWGTPHAIEVEDNHPAM